eukprot:TRINITY_DN438_c0_g2_i1.p1 TRINITY_DN438_c0_g2~~TRINITY_DN438_c0_g2_i1.p1  ORF type:complete len:300 (-),score=43.51 TRINITY_DN438_c0_g2_i1:285-1184(-)
MAYYVVPLYVLAAIYACVFLLAAVQFLILRRNTPGPLSRETKKLFRVLTMIVCVGRCIYNTATPFIFADEPTYGERLVELVFPRMISIVYYSTYMLLVVVWARLFYTMQDPNEEFQAESDAKIEKFYNRVNTFLISIQLVFIGLFFITKSGDGDDLDMYYDLVSANSIFLAALMIMWAVGFAWFGLLLYINMKAVAANTFLRSRQLVLLRLRKVSTITAICTLCFLIRAILTCMYMNRNELDERSDKFVNGYVIVYFVGEIIPSILVLTQGSPIRLTHQHEEKRHNGMEVGFRPPSTNV